MQKRLKYIDIAPKAMNILYTQEAYFHEQFRQSDTMNMTIWELVKLRISQINQCAFCIDMHSKDALKLGEKPERIWGLSAWKDMHFYSDAEHVALGWAELLTAGLPVSDDTYQLTLNTFGDKAMVNLTIAINAINSWNRIVKAFKPQVGVYQPK
ncbi:MULTISPECIES: carboxymuconolactone decarboxylase family protein [Vibrio]|uniref:Carboxymuconolactone decarboxylase family protein n=1 Tax=Vibrio kanaloae TaxID=170673 RepID=A0ABV4LI21_9VIBR|nr:carboxymuconolactone decarboxylase family protein [Vibrio kanaloae]NOJ00140.1 carboxymuconolactone decarboxylase family protein [Vibrio kanaloae]OEF15107.1 alkylhydroperoxidase [Vibrio kanaloae 5S-149]QPK05986.1 carboxymuconolactone decarboxylase family protein [Vibrio kanaloae]